ncbi:ubinuclein-2 isoform X4 [Rosa chinensis]|uniref:ubinuclein-2 isoform X4 n=1 Tax=Rosa chinensis TaxID=74649 RepID=UPI001AD9372D|nr:ubinuclein-2 isoform X4 [Rosa chinensis]
MGKDSSDDEDQNIPDDDQYDTEDSFIDDAELDEYFEVDNSAIKHDGFFVNRGQLERINTTAALPNQQPKKRRRKEAKSPGETDDCHVPNKQAKLVMNPSPLKALDGDASALQVEVKDIDKSKSGILLPKDSSNRFKDSGGSSDASYHKYHDKNAYSQTKTQSGRLSGNADELESSVRAKVKNGIRQLLDLNLSDGKYSVPTTVWPPDGFGLVDDRLSVKNLILLKGESLKSLFGHFSLLLYLDSYM